MDMSTTNQMRLDQLASKLADVERQLKTEQRKRRRLEKELAQTEKQFAACFEGAGDGVLFADSTGHFVDVDARGARLLCYTRQELLKLSIFDIVAEHERSRVPEELALLAKGIPHVAEWQLLRKDGSTFWGEVNSQLLPDGYAIGVVRDITERRQTQEKLRQSEAFLNGVIEQSPHSLWISDDKGNLIRTNQALREQLEVTDEEVVGKYNIFNDDVVREQGLLPAVQDVFENGKTVRFCVEYDTSCVKHIKLAKTKSLYLDTTISPVIGPDGKVCNAVIQHLDITDLKRMEADLSEAKERFRSVLENSFDAAYRWNVQADCCDYVSPAIEKIVGFTPEELRAFKAKDVIARVHPDDLPIVQGEIEKPKGKVMEFRLRTKAGSYRWLADATQVILDNTGKRLYRVGMVRDITDRKQIEANRLMLSKLESAALFAGGLAHDFNNLLTSIMLNVTMANSPETSPLERELTLETVREATVAASGLTKQLLAFARGGKPVRKLTNLSGVIEGSVRVALSGSVVRSEVSVASDLHAAQVDEQQIGQVLRNMLLNARDAMPEGGVVHVRAENVDLPFNGGPALPSGAYVRVSVTDTGCGIQPEALQKIYDPYFSTKKKGQGKGRGLGLTICHSIIQKHGGAITVESTPGEGTTFQFYLPSNQLQTSADENKKIEAAIPTRRKILVMDDEHCMRLALSSVLEGKGYEVVLSSDGQKAIDLYSMALREGKPFAGVILDLTIRGGLGGQETIDALLKIDPDVKALVMSGYSEDPVLLNPQKYGFKGGLEKSFDVELLTATLSRVLES